MVSFQQRMLPNFIHCFVSTNGVPPISILKVFFMERGVCIYIYKYVYNIYIYINMYIIYINIPFYLSIYVSIYTWKKMYIDR